MTRKEKIAQFENETYRIHVIGRNVQVTDTMKDYAIEKVSKIEKFSHRIIDVQIKMDIQKLEHRVDLVIKVDHTKIKSRGVSDDMYASIDMAVEKLESQLRRYKTRLNEHHAKPLKEVDLEVNVLQRPEDAELLDVNLEIESENRQRELEQFKPHEVVSKKTRSLRTLTQDEAVMKMELSGDAFLIYRGEEDQKLKVIYRRKDENYGLIKIEN